MRVSTHSAQVNLDEAPCALQSAAAALAAPAPPRTRTAKAGDYAHARTRWHPRPPHAGERACASSKGRSAFEPLLRPPLTRLAVLLQEQINRG
eukprot:COSAG04_NODE_5812_length_1486_cov_2.061283_2_plen_93_part_00